MPTDSDKEVRRYLFVMSDTGGGHRSSALAVRDEMQRLYGMTVSIEVADIFVESQLWPFRCFPRWYAPMVKLKSIPYGWFFHATDDVQIVRAVSSLLRFYTGEPACRFLRQHAPDVVASFHPVPNYTLMWACRQMPNPPLLITVAVDLVTVHASCFAPGAHMHFVPTELARRRALRCGVPADRVEILGSMPVRRAFIEARALPRVEVRRRLNLPTDRPIVLMVGGGEGLGPLAKVVRALAQRRPPAHLVAITGRNQSLYQRLHALDLPVPLQVEGFVPDMELWMRAADLLVTKAGPNTLCEAFVVGLPVVIYSALRGQEEGNADYVVVNGAGLWAPHPEQAAEAVMELLADPERLSRMSERASRLANPNAAAFLARRLWDIGQTCVELVGEAVARPEMAGANSS